MLRNFTFLLLLSVVLLGILGCEEEKTPKSQEEKQAKPSELSTEETIVDTFTLSTLQNLSHKVTLSNQKVMFHDVTQPITFITLFASWCPPCLAQIEMLNDLQKSYAKELFVVAMLTHDESNATTIAEMIKTHHINYYLSVSKENSAVEAILVEMLKLPKNFDIPIVIMYVEGEYFTHYEGNVPIEMIEYDISQAKKQLK